MKKLVLIALVLFSFSSFAQVKFGVKGAYNLPVWNFTNETSFDKTSSGYMIGALVDFKVLEKMSVRVEANYTTYSFTIAETAGNGFDASFIEIPIVIRKNVGGNFNVNSGFGFGFKMSSSGFLMASEPAADEIPILVNYKEEYLSTMRLFWVSGISYDFKSGLFLDVKMNINLNNLDTETVDFVKGITSFTFGLGYTFDFTK